ncbi:DNA photolyase [Ramaria rubella]|nr:DNA photolyase [Ramaria rubella]
MSLKRAFSITGRVPLKKSRTEVVVHSKIATADAAARVDADPPFFQLLKALRENNAINEQEGDSVIYWMRLEDMRIIDNRALALASDRAQKLRIPLIVLFIISPQDYKAHDRSPRRIDFALRNLRVLKSSLADLHIPLHIIEHYPRHTLPHRVVSLALEWKSTHIFANIEHEVDELRRDIVTLDLCHQSELRCIFINDKCIVEPGRLKTKQDTPYVVYSPWLKNWLPTLHEHPEYLLESPPPAPNSETIHKSPIFSVLFSSPVPDFVEGFVCLDKIKMEELWPAGTDVALKVLQGFLHAKARKSQIGDKSPFFDGVEDSTQASRIVRYAEDRDRSDFDSTSRLSPYLSSGVISARECIRQTLKLTGRQRVQIGRMDGVGMWVQELAWRDFYTHVIAAFPRVSMGRPFLEKFANVRWETNEGHLQAWKDGKTGIPIVDAAMRQANTQGWMHNRCRMIVAMFLTKDLMLDWRLGEKYFMEILIDGDLASNNGGWQWSASTGVDPQPYFRIFNPLLQSEKADPSGDYIRYFVPELQNLRGKVVYDPYNHMPKTEFLKLGYPEPIVVHKDVKGRALRRYKNVGEL